MNPKIKYFEKEGWAKVDRFKNKYLKWLNRFGFLKIDKYQYACGYKFKFKKHDYGNIIILLGKAPHKLGKAYAMQKAKESAQYIINTLSRENGK